MMSPPAGPFVPETEYNVLLTVRKGAREQGPRRGKQIHIKLRPSEGFDVLRAKVLNPNNFRGEENLISEDIFIKRAKNQPQSAYVLLTEDTFLISLAHRWNYITEKDVASYQRENRLVAEEFQFEFFVYIHKHTPPSPIPRSLHQARDSTRVAADVRAFQAAAPQQDDPEFVDIGEIFRNYFATVAAHARRAEGMPAANSTTSSTRQAQSSLGQVRREVTETERRPSAAPQYLTLEVKINIDQLREALGLPTVLRSRENNR